MLSAVVIAGTIPLAWATYVTGQARNDPDRSTLKLREAGPELATKVTGSFTVAAVGDILMHDPVAHMADQKLLQILRDADVAMGNMESTIIDKPSFDAAWQGNFVGKEGAADVKAMGFDIMTHANNHTFDLGEDGMRSTSAMLREVGIVPAGVGKHLADARLPKFLQTPNGRVGVIGLVSSSGVGGGGGAMATYRVGDMGGKPGVNALRLTTYNVVTPDQLKQLQAIRESVYARRNEVLNPVVLKQDPPDRVQMFETWFKAGPHPGNYDYEMNRGDLRDILRNVRNGKRYGDFIIVTIHSHENQFAFQQFSLDNHTPQFLIDFARQCIDNGADMFVGHGVHTIRGMEIYKGKPIFYGVSNFLIHENMLQMDVQSYLSQGENPFTTEKTAAEISEVATVRLEQPHNMEALLTTSRFESGRLAEVRIYPVDVGQEGRPYSRMGIPMTPSPAMAQRVLAKLQKFSDQFGTKIAIESNVGVIRVSGTESSAGRQ
jgi:poly-gamma-glutamate synthesis protein (capsule biosynthesis protein)